ncbi:helix-hairpin-helix domain-containing protein [Paenisporosarcina cavernae]|uniref:Competence protein ComEA n=1 Tax=Paenisporosarcina cavernae TaxID=2320858 RepID=A0A385YSN5_9BACL|nr:helix-hairpin-helix domain-containing protein [Paenisporosarcina cavernae]AYC29686.1 competence protein ComEA [Paenisporosarcina cavernae]
MQEMKSLWKEKKVLLLLFLSPTVVLLLYIFTSFSPKEEIIPDNSFPSISSEVPDGLTTINEMAEDSTPHTSLMVDIKGQVLSPGVYELAEGKRIQDAILLAGDVTVEADLTQVNLAQLVKDEMIIYVPVIGEQPILTLPFVSTSSKQDGAVPINSATSADFDQLPGIGPSKADAIVQYREENGPFKTLDELKEVPGIGDVTFAKFEERLSLK